MLEDRLSITEVALELGYQNLPQFSRSIKRMTGLAPRALKSRLIK
ncbi:hypothetical protein JCM19232_524 [Vibrio ishigakensis]|uniref:HTH araC/xylS-type domain-containing protein n=1 Tax=Vibrio ishigakensis TaxID=1481914 RepID=A0A0B8P1U0_9VIBR|nr:hypothetical protein JCM19232_524 [Vibrio ishigakensis]GAM66418.1 hypothetical protein JCM19236_3870 [Vibrio sp. JCM 19236]